MARILISGASGLIGSSLATFFESYRDEVTRLVRRRPRSSDERQWDPMREIPPDLVSAFDVVVHLSGESVSGRWNEAKKKRIRGSRVITTQNLARALVEAEIRPKVFVCASAIGYYGDRGNEVLTEDSPAGNGFLAEVSREWESATALAADAHINTTNLRTGIVLSREGGALKQILLPFRLGLGGRVGDGRQWWSWIHIDDFVAAIQRIVDDTKGGASHGLLSGPINMTSPTPVTNDEFTRTLARVLKRPAVLPVPAFAARLAFGEFAQEGLLSSARVQPKKLLEAGFQFRFPRLEMALSELIAKPE
jgi:uncharacterized protein (TIGR01777 family)